MPLSLADRCFPLTASLYMAAQLYIDRESAVSAAWVPSLWKPCNMDSPKKTWSMGLIVVDISIVNVIIICIIIYIYINFGNMLNHNQFH